VRGDGNQDGSVDLADALATLGYLFGGKPPPCLPAADANASAALDLTDPIDLLNFLFQAGLPPPPPHPACGEDAGGDDRGCLRSCP
jgi:hypothetical protein